ncbi:hypothetical protein AB4307_03215 [Vibrio sp. 10N.261.52.C2]|uniref:hypothetical protein n=1 Tax=unclassified Vibrio TaxID=2614977 RepID=UPI00352EACA8
MTITSVKSSFSFENDSKLLLNRAKSDDKVSMNLKGSKAERMAQFMKLHAQKAQELQLAKA